MRYLLLDHCSIMFRAYYAVRNVCQEKQDLKIALNLYRKWIKEFKFRFQADFNLSIYDVNNRQASNFSEFSGYKAGRHIDDLFHEGMNRFSDIDIEEGYGQIGVSGNEADDVICSVITQATTDEDEVVVISSDKDLLQVANDRVTVFSQTKGADLKVWTPDVIREKFNIDEPYQIADLKAFTGDGSDGYAGVHGVGGVGATKLLHHYHDFYKVYEALDNDRDHDVIKGVLRKRLIDGREDGFTCYRLAKLDDDIELSAESNFFKTDTPSNRFDKA